jgi:hypothetical protein
MEGVIRGSPQPAAGAPTHKDTLRGNTSEIGRRKFISASSASLEGEYEHFTCVLFRHVFAFLRPRLRLEGNERQTRLAKASALTLCICDTVMITRNIRDATASSSLSCSGEWLET